MTTFDQLGLPLQLVHQLRREGIEQPFPVQAAAIPNILAGRDVLGCGPTGSGKTFAFGLPMLAQLSGAPSRPKYPRALVLAPTRELALQIHSRLDAPAAALGLRILAVVGGVNIKRDTRFLAAPVDLLVATPGRAIDLVRQRMLFLSAVEITAIDECDQMSDMGFLPQVHKLLKLTPAGQRLLFSATLDGDVQELIDRYTNNPVHHATAQASVDTMRHFFSVVEENRDAVVAKIAGRKGKTLLFRRTRFDVDRQVASLRAAGINALGIHGNKGQATRTAAIDAFTSGDVPVLVATDVAARGIDISDVSLVVHVDPPEDYKAYLHRAGRTARAGNAGTVVTLITSTKRSQLTNLFAQAGVSAVEVDAARLAKITGAHTQKGTRVDQRRQHRKRRAGR